MDLLKSRFEQELSVILWHCKISCGIVLFYPFTRRFFCGPCKLCGPTAVARAV